MNGLQQVSKHRCVSEIVMYCRSRLNTMVHVQGSMLCINTCHQSTVGKLSEI